MLSIQNDSHVQNIGLFTGNMGVCVALYLMGKKYNIPQAEAEADKLLYYIQEHISELTNIGFRDGLSGIGWAICVLKKNNCIYGDLDDILYNIDAVIYKVLTKNTSDFEIDINNGLIGYLMYIVARLEEHEHHSNSIQHTLLIAALKIIINKIFEYTFILFERLTKDREITLLLDFPVLLIYLKKARHLDVYSYKIDNIIQYWTHLWRQRNAYYETNRLALGISLALYEKDINNGLINNCVGYLLSNIDFHRVEQEINFETNSIHKGWIYTLLLLHIGNRLPNINKKYQSQISILRESICDRCVKPFISYIKKTSPINISFIHGLSGIAVLLALHPCIFGKYGREDSTQKEIEYLYGKRSHLR